jgi:hypothetical protein
MIQLNILVGLFYKKKNQNVTIEAMCFVRKTMQLDISGELKKQKK